MDNEQQPDANEDRQPLPESQPTTERPKSNRKRLWLIIGIVAVLIVGGLAAFLVTRKNKPEAPVASVSSSSVKSTAPKKTASASGNTWKSTVDPTAIPLGDGKVSTAPQAGYIDSCTTSFKGGGARHAGSWINTANNTWNSQTKVAVEGSVSWPSANYSASVSGSSRILTTNDLPEHYKTGNFPISFNDPAYQYDSNPNHIAAQNVTYSLPLNPAAAAAPSCLGLGPIGMLSDGVLLYDALDAAGRDAVAHETQDSCNGHPDGQERYHYHDVASCVRNAASGSSALVGYALDGYGIYVERDQRGNLPTDADLDACHGRTSTVMWNGKLTSIYHYDATLEYPYTLGCYHGTPIVTPRP